MHQQRQKNKGVVVVFFLIWTLQQRRKGFHFVTCLFHNDVLTQ